MDQLSLKLPRAELDFLKWYAEKHATPKATLYREVTIEHFRKWKQNHLLNEYMKGDISFKEFCKLANVSFFKAMTIIEESDLELIIPAIITEYTTELTKKHIKDQDFSIFKDNKPIKREAPFIEFKDDE